MPQTVINPLQRKPTSMRYERIQDILDNEPALRQRISPKSHPVDTRFGEKMLVSKETIEITDSLHAAGRDAHKVPRAEVLLAAARILKLLPAANGEVPPKPAEPAARPIVPEHKKKSVKPVTAAKPKPQVRKQKQSSVKPAPESAVAAAPDTDEPVQPEAAKLPAPEALPVSELPPERQPLRLPASADPRKYPHYSIQTSIYSLLLSALSLSENYEKMPGTEERQSDLEAIVKKYLNTCDALKVIA